MEKTKAFNIENGFHFYAIIPAFINRGLQSLLQFPNRKFYSKNTEKKIYSKQIINRFNRTKFNIFVLSLLHLHKLLFFTRNKIFILIYRVIFIKINAYFTVSYSNSLKIFNPNEISWGGTDCEVRSTKITWQDLERDRRMAFSNNIFSKSPSGSSCSAYAWIYMYMLTYIIRGANPVAASSDNPKQWCMYYTFGICRVQILEISFKSLHRFD